MPAPGKTTTITRRIANQVATGTFRPDQILAVTFTDKAAGEMRARLGRLGVSGVAARTFHSAALAQLHHFAPGRVGQILASKALLLRQIGNTLPAPYKFRPAGDLATEIEWAKNRRLTPETYQRELGDHQPPIPADLAYCVFYEYEQRKEGAGAVDFEDLLELAIRLYDEDETALMTVRDRYRAFTVDEYQDVNLLQQTLLERWLGAATSSARSATTTSRSTASPARAPSTCSALPQRFPHAQVIRLEQNYRSTPQILELANRLVPRLGGAEKVLRATRADGPAPELPRAPIRMRSALRSSRVAARCTRADRVRGDGDSLPAQLALGRARIGARRGRHPVPGRVAARPRRGARARQGAPTSRRRAGGDRGARRPRSRAGLEQPQTGLGEREQTRQNDLGRLVRLAEELEDGRRRRACVPRDARGPLRLARRTRRGVHLLTLHRAKGLEFEAVFVPRLEEKELPAKQAKTPAELAEERRLFYVGLTRARSGICSSRGRASRAASSASSASSGPRSRHARRIPTIPSSPR